MATEALPSIIIVEDSLTYSGIMRKQLSNTWAVDVKCAATLKEASTLLDDASNDFFLAILDMNLPDASGAEIVDLLNSHDVPSIVFTAGVQNDVRRSLWERGVVDYVVKGPSFALDYLIGLVGRLLKNRSTKVLVVEDSITTRAVITRMLKAHQFLVYEASTGVEGLSVLEIEPDIRLIITDYNMPGMDGAEFTGAVRKNFGQDQLAILALSGTNNSILTARFLKAGANDFLTKPFESEEFYCRINQNMRILDLFDEIRRTSNTDYLTGLTNRRHFFEVAGRLYANAKRGNLAVSVAVFDIDHFKSINDTHGHAAGDEALKVISAAIQERLRDSDIICRFGGEEFCAMLVGADIAETRVVLDEIREHVGSLRILIPGETIRATVSVGATTDLDETFEDMIRVADELLYRAKESGRNRVVMGSD